MDRHNAELDTLNIAVGSKNPAKIRAVENAIRKCVLKQQQQQQQQKELVKLNILGFDVPSGVADQPFGDAETCSGAKNRAKAAYESYLLEHHTEPDLAIGMEGGLEYRDDKILAVPRSEMDCHQSDQSNLTLYCMAWMAVYGKRNHTIVSLFVNNDDNNISISEDIHPIYGIAKSGK
jgi:Protein of unknown function DUF84